jgi:xanthine dehydrogenase molybdopterin-binding subunit B
MEFRMKNFLKDGDMLLVGHPFHGHNPLADMVKQLGDTSNFKQRKQAVDEFNKVSYKTNHNNNNNDNNSYNNRPTSGRREDCPWYR